jgi:hypothetical protein
MNIKKIFDYCIINPKIAKMATSATDEAPPPTSSVTDEPPSKLLGAYIIDEYGNIDIKDVKPLSPEQRANVKDEFIRNKHALDQSLYTFLNTTFNYKVASETHTTTIIDALRMLRKNYTRFDFMDVIQTYIELLRKDVHLDDGLLSQLERLINEFKDLLNPWVDAQSITGDAKERQRVLPVRLAEVLKTNCENKLRIITASDNPSQNFMHQMVKKLCDYFQIRIDDSMRHGFDINKEVHIGSALYFFLKHYDQLLLPILEQIRIENQTPDSKELIDLIKYKKAVFVGGRRTRHKRSGHKRSGKSGHKRSGKRSAHHKRSNKRSGKRSAHKRSGKRSAHKRSVHKSRRR